MEIAIIRIAAEIRDMINPEKFFIPRPFRAQNK